MAGTARVTHSLRVVIAATAVLAITSAPADAQYSPQHVTPIDLSSLDGPFKMSTWKNTVPESWLAGIEMNCIGCRGFDQGAMRPDSTNQNAPWLLQGKWRRQTALGTVSTGFVGIRNYTGPLSMVTPIGGDVDPRALGSWSASYLGPSSQWSLTASFEKTLATFARGTSVGVTADVLLPVTSESVTVGDALLRSRTIRAGIIFRW